MKKEMLTQFNGIKGLAFIFIFLWHVSSLLPFDMPRLGSSAVEMFFVVSGFLISYNYYENTYFDLPINGIKYSAGKAKKIYLLYFITLAPSALLFWRNILKSPTLASVLNGGGYYTCKFSFVTKLDTF